MGTAEKVLKIIKAEHLGDHVLKLLFSDGTEREIDFKPFLERSRHPEIRKFLSLRRFKRISLQNGELMWGDFDLIFPIIDLYYNLHFGAFSH
ncbi:MAG: DUF2442 domain-containing protein [Elusimicrobia bacterium]|nr:DUF2442 domain-containing protein [Elusimicrobiota bacterium]